MPQPGPDPAVVRSPSGLPVLSPSPAASGSPSASSPAPVPPSPLPAAARPPLTVLNNSRRTGLAARAAERFRAGGWPVAATGNLRGRTPVTTVYYAPGQEGAAVLLRREFPAISRALPRYDGLPGSGLTVVVTREFPA